MNLKRGEKARRKANPCAGESEQESDLPATDENPNHLEDFKRLLSEAAQKRSPED